MLNRALLEQAINGPMLARFSGQSAGQFDRTTKANLPDSGTQSAVIFASKKPSFGEVEKHLSDYRRGRGYLSSDIAADLRQLNRDNSTALSESNPKQYTRYLAYSTALSYETKARYVKAINNSTEAMATITSTRLANVGGIISHAIDRYQTVKNRG